MAIRPFAARGHVVQRGKMSDVIRKSTLKLVFMPSLSVSWRNGKEIWFIENVKFYKECILGLQSFPREFENKDKAAMLVP
jgi:hypothetical protein